MPVKFRTNVAHLLQIPVEVQPVHPTWSRGYRVDATGVPHVLPSVGGITCNLRVGGPALGWVADHAEPCVTARNPDENKNNGATLLSCVGNKATVASGDAKGHEGLVTGKHGGVEHIMIDFPDDTLKELAYGDTIRIEAFGQGLAIEEAGDIRLMNLDPGLLSSARWPLGLSEGRLRVPVAKTLPAKIMGSGIGADACQRGDYDIQLFDEGVVREYGLADLRLGDIVAITDADHSFGRIYRTGAVSVGVVVHGACIGAGHGPGVTTLITSASGAIEPVADARANVAYILKAGTSRTAPKARRRTPAKRRAKSRQT